MMPGGFFRTLTLEGDAAVASLVPETNHDLAEVAGRCSPCVFENPMDGSRITVTGTVHLAGVSRHVRR